MTSFPTLSTPRLTLREILPCDAADLLHIHGNAQHMAWFGCDPNTDLNGAQQLVATFASWRQQATPGTRWGLSLAGQPQLIGTCGLFACNRSWRKCSIGYELAPEFTGLGLMREALQTVLSWGFEQMALNRIEALVHEENRASLKLLQGLGFVREGLLREVAYWGGRHHDLVQFGLLARDWGDAQAPFSKP